MIKRKVFLICILVVMAISILLSGCTIGYRVGGKALTGVTEDNWLEEPTLYDNVMTMLVKGTVQDLKPLSASSKDFEEEWKVWENLREEYGEYQSYALLSVYEYGEDTVLCGTVQFANGKINVDAKVDKDGKLIELWSYVPAGEEDETPAMPETIMEQAVVIGEGTDYPLEGLITMPAEAANGTKQYPAVVLVPSNGAADKDMSAGNTHMFRDLAWGLAEQGIIVIRYDKRTYTYPEVWESSPSVENLTIEWEFAEDVLFATELLRQQPMVDAEKIYLIGHGLGGLIAPRIDQAGGDYAGMILLAVPDSTWQDAAYHQYLNYGLADMKEDNLYYICSFLEAQLQDINKGLGKYSEDSLINETLLGMRGAYWINLNEMDYVEAIKNMEKPILLLQGGEDYQIRSDENYDGWQKKLKDKANVQFGFYEEANHLFMQSQGCFMGNAKEYDMPNHVMDEVISDMVRFIVG